MTTPPDLTREDRELLSDLSPEDAALVLSKLGRKPRTYEGSALERYHEDCRATREMRQAERDREFEADYRGQDLASCRAQSAKARAARLLRTPPWADLDAIKAVYRKAWELSRETGTPHHVDHEIPLQGRKVSGLHVHGNLRVIPAFDNLSKGNRFEVES